MESWTPGTSPPTEDGIYYVILRSDNVLIVDGNERYFGILNKVPMKLPLVRGQWDFVTNWEHARKSVLFYKVVAWRTIPVITAPDKQWYEKHGITT